MIGADTVRDMDANGGAAQSYVLFAWSPTGYELREEHGEPPAPGHTIGDGEGTLVVTKVGRSPLPGDDRACVYTLGR